MASRNWRNAQHFPSEWLNRTKIAARLIENGWSVVEFGAGNGVLGNILGNKNKYLPTDLIKRSDDFEVVNLDFHLKQNNKFDVGVALGVLEYVGDFRFTLGELAKNLPNFIATYCCARFRFPRFKSVRKSIGWKNHLTRIEFEQCLYEAGFQIVYKEIIEKRIFYRQYLYKVKNQHA